MSDFEQAVKTAAEKAVLKIIGEGSWIQPDYANRFKMPTEMMDDIWKMVDVGRLKKEMALRLEAELAERIINKIAEELSTDIKQILSIKERREAIRGIAREHMEAIMSAGLSSGEVTK